MPKAFGTWTILPHRPIEKLEPNLWRVEGNLPRGKGTRVMTVAKRRGGGLVIYNAIALEPDLMAELEAFGTPEVLIVPNGFHRLDAKVFKQRYPQLRVVAPARARKRVERVVHVDATFAELAAEPDDDVAFGDLDGTAGGEGYLDVKSGDARTLVFNDCILNLPKLRGPIGFMLGPTGKPAVPRFARWMLIKDRAAFKAGLDRFAAAPGLKRIIVSHGQVLDQAPGDVLRTVAAELGG